MIIFNNAEAISIDGKPAEQIKINGIIVWEYGKWFDPIHIQNSLYIRSAMPQTQIGTNVSLGKAHNSGEGGGEA